MGEHIEVGNHVRTHWELDKHKVTTWVRSHWQQINSKKIQPFSLKGKKIGSIGLAEQNFYF